MANTNYERAVHLEIWHRMCPNSLNSTRFLDTGQALGMLASESVGLGQGVGKTLNDSSFPG